MRQVLRDETGATAVEYGFVASLIAVVIIVAVTFLGEQVRAILDEVASWL